MKTRDLNTIMEPADSAKIAKMVLQLHQTDTILAQSATFVSNV